MTLTDEYRSANLALRAGSLRDFLKLWALLDPQRMDETFPGWSVAASTLIDRDRRRASGLASAYLKATRRGSGVAGDATVILASSAPDAQVRSSLATTARAGYYTALRTRTEQEAAKVALVRASGAATRLILDGGRSTITRSLAADPLGTGWRRVAGVGACKFCLMLTGRGAIYSAETADFSSHDHCGCTVEPVYGGSTRNVRPYEPSATRRNRDADDARAREFMRSP